MSASLLVHMVAVRYLDDFIVGFQTRRETDRFLNVLREGLLAKLRLKPTR